MCNLKNLGDFSLLFTAYVICCVLEVHCSAIFPRCSSISRWISLFFSVVFIVVSTVCIDFSHIIYDYQSFHVFSDGF